MNKLLYITALVMLFTTGKAQDTDYSQLGNVINAFYSSLSDTAQEKRASTFEQLFTTDGQINSIIQKTPSSSSYALGSWKDFMRNSAPFYAGYNVDYDEIEREIDYYVDLASVHSLVYQTVVDRKSGATYRQMLWFQFDLVYANDRWHIDHVLWINQIDQYPIGEALLQDTLWHKPSR